MSEEDWAGRQAGEQKSLKATCASKGILLLDQLWVLDSISSVELQEETKYKV